VTDIGLRINRVAFNAGFTLVLGCAITRDIFGIPDGVGAALLSIGALMLVIPFVILVSKWTPLFKAGAALKLPSNRGSEHVTALIVCLYLGYLALFGDRSDLSLSQAGSLGLFIVLFCYFALGACIEYDEARSDAALPRASPDLRTNG
jgi:hypothetical protein